MQYSAKSKKGFSFVEVIIMVSVISLVFGGLFTAFQYSIKVINLSRAKLSAISLANDRMEYFRSLPYDSVGVVAGFPSGIIPQNSTTTFNTIDFTERVRVDYVDDPKDGLAALDSNGITTDYKRVRVEHSWVIDGEPGKTTMMSYIVPRSIETNVGGGTVRINVINSVSQILPGAQVTLRSDSGAYEVTSVTDVTGAALFSVPAGSGYEVTVSGPIAGNEYSTDGTYVATTSNPNPVSVPFSVLEADVSTLTFQIDRVSDLLLTLKTSVTEAVAEEDFSSLGGVASSTNVTSNGNEILLTNTAGIYENLGSAYLAAITPATLEAWQLMRIAKTTETDTVVRVTLFTGVPGAYVAVPDSDLPGNSSGFTDTIIDLSALSVVSYPSLVVGLTLETSDTSDTPYVDEVLVLYRESAVPLTNENFTIRGEKIIGQTTTSTPIYKFSETTTTDGSGERLFADREFDLYTIGLSSAYDVASGCPGFPYSHQAGVDTTVELALIANETHSLRVSVLDEAGVALPGATVALSRPGYSEEQFTNACGQTFFPGEATPASDFSLTVSAAGYTAQTLTGVALDGDQFQEITLIVP